VNSDPGTPVRVVEHDDSTREPLPAGRVFGAEVTGVTEVYISVRYTGPVADGSDRFYRDSRWRAWDGEFRWRLEPVDDTERAAFGLPPLTP
jgi:hypothetical protein